MTYKFNASAYAQASKMQQASSPLIEEKRRKIKKQ